MEPSRGRTSAQAGDFRRASMKLGDTNPWTGDIGTFRDVQPQSTNPSAPKKESIATTAVPGSESCSGTTVHGKDSVQNDQLPTSALQVAAPRDVDEDKKVARHGLPSLFGLYGLLMVTCVALGIAAGVLLRKRGAEITPQVVVYIRYPGEMLLQGMLMVEPLLQVSGMVLSAGEMGPRLLLKVLGFSFAYVLLTCMAGQAIVVLLLSTVQTGNEVFALVGRIPVYNSSSTAPYTTVANGLVRTVFPGSVVDAFIFYWEVVSPRDTSEDLAPSVPLLSDLLASRPPFGVNSLGLVTFSLFLGVALGQREEGDDVIFDFVGNFVDVMLQFALILSWFLPLGLGFLTADWVLRMPELQPLMETLGHFVLTVLLSYVVQATVVMPVLYVMFVKHDYGRFLAQLVHPLIVAGGTQSSMAAVPTSILSAETCLNRQLVRLLVPMQAVVRKDGSSIMIMCMLLSVAQSQHIDMDAKTWFGIFLSTTFSSFLVSGVRRQVLAPRTSVMLPAIGLSIDADLPFDSALRLLDPLMTVLNVGGDLVGVAMVQSLLGQDLKNMSVLKHRRSTAPVDPEFIYRTRLKPS